MLVTISAAPVCLWRRGSLLAAFAIVLGGALPTCAAAESMGYSTPGAHTFTVPANVDQITVSASGAGGGMGGRDGVEPCTPGKGGNLEATFSVTPGSMLSIVVGGAGGETATFAGGQGGVGGGGAGGTGTGGFGGGGGGGASTVANASGAPLLIAGGGGGCGVFQIGAEGGGNDGVAGGNGAAAHGGAAGGQTNGGAGGASANGSDPAGGNGQGGQGGAGVAAQNGGGGGGGFFGGGGGGGVRIEESAAGGGGGGSDLFGAGAFDVSSDLGSNAGNGQVTLTYTGGPVPALPVGPPGATGAQGPAGPAGQQGPPGPAGKVELVTCTTTSKTVEVHGKSKQVKQKKCSTQLVTTTVKFTTSKLTHVALERGGLLYAEGTANRVDGIERLTLRARRALPAGRYTLTFRTHPGDPPARTTIMIS
ncbi:MAG TPA: collagen-like protein [Solirubrobacteraceae bacterium]|jgi:hypothetical protein|nr:collagen-like protein [Solirubrobacteraceae bacterium]